MKSFKNLKSNHLKTLRHLLDLQSNKSLPPTDPSALREEDLRHHLRRRRASWLRSWWRLLRDEECGGHDGNWTRVRNTVRTNVLLPPRRGVIMERPTSGRFGLIGGNWWNLLHLLWNNCQLAVLMKVCYSRYTRLQSFILQIEIQQIHISLSLYWIRSS